MKAFLRVLSMFMCVMLSSTVKAELIVLSYHDVDNPTSGKINEHSMSITNKTLTEQFSWLKANGFNVISVDDLVAANKGITPLPNKPVLLTFDDGYQGMYRDVFPLLKRFNYSAVLALMGKWLETPEDEKVLYGQTPMERDHFLTWEQIREMSDSGLVEVASHSYDLHQGVLANPQGNTQPSATTHRYDAALEQYEDDASYRSRIRADLQKSVELIKHETGKAPRIVVWPYGAYNQVTIDIAKELGMPITMSLDEGYTDIKNLGNIHRLLIGHHSDISDFNWLINDQIRQTIDPIRVVHVDLDYIYDQDLTQQTRNLDKLLDRIKSMGISTVYLQAYADPDGDGNANSLYFPNRHLPMRADLFNRVSWQLSTRAGVKVYAWMPVLAFDLPDNHPLASHLIQASPKRQQVDYRRFSPFSPDALSFVGDIYEDLARYTKFHGLIFHDDAYINDYEDTSSWAMEAYKKAGFPTDIDLIRADPKLFNQWSKFKTLALAQWTDVLADRARLFQGRVKTARNMYASAVLYPESEAWLAQSMAIFLSHYDYTAIMAMPYMENAKNPEEWLAKLVNKVAEIPGALDKTVFELQSVNWKKSTPVPAETLAEQMRILLLNGARHYGYYPDDFIQDRPNIETLRPVFSLTSLPQ